GDLQHERVAAPDGAGGRRDELAVDDAGVERVAFAGIDAVTEGRVDHHSQRGDFAVLTEDHANRHVQLSEARGGTALGGDVGSVDYDVLHGHVMHQSSSWRGRNEGSSVQKVSGTLLPSAAMTITAALFDFGGVILSSPFEAFA